MNTLVFSKTLQIVLCVLLVVLVLIQSKTAGLSPSLKSSFSMYRSLRGVEKTVVALTAITGFLLVVNSLVIVLFS